jgi:hypothetical protein
MSLPTPEEEENTSYEFEDTGKERAPSPARRAPRAPRVDARRRRHARSGAADRVERLAGVSVTAVANIMVIAILAGALIFTLLRLNSDNSSNSLRSGALSAASTYGVDLSSYNYKNLLGPGSPWAEAEAHATPKFKKAFSSTSADLSKLLDQYSATATGQVVDAGISSISGSRAVVLLFIDQTVTNSAQRPNTAIQPLRVRLTMVLQNGKWLIDNLEVPK